MFTLIFSSTNVTSDGNIRYFEYENDKFEYLTEYKSPDPQRGIAFLPKRGVNVHENEVARAYKTVADSYIEPISFIVPRRAEVFQEDIYPPTFGLKSAMSANDWFGGKTALPPRVSLKGRYEGGEPNELAPEEQKRSTPASAPTSSTTAPKPEAQPANVKVVSIPEAVAERPKLTELKDNKQAMAAMANKFADHEESSDDDSSSFEEIAKPVERPARDAPPTTVKALPTTPQSHSSTISRNTAPIQKPTETISAPTSETTSTSRPTTSGGLAEGLKAQFSDIKTGQSNQLSEITELKGQVSELTDLVKQLSSRLDSLAGSQSERIRRVELELENMRE